MAKLRKKKTDSKNHANSLTPFIDKVDETSKLFIPSQKDIDDLERTPCSPLDSYFLGVADKHGIDLLDDDYGDEQ